MKTKVIFTFPPEIVEKPISHTLMKEFDLWINILRAKIEPSEGGKLVIELQGDEENIKAGIELAERSGVGVTLLEHDVLWDKELCVDCGACISLCPTQALTLDRDTFKLNFDFGRCVACGSCAQVCPVKAISINF
ncbi:MAG: 4Fe-4S binding protein [Candidatus Methanofastidiosia archaeon]